MRSRAKKEECRRAWRIEGRRPELRVEVRGAALHRAFPHHDRPLEASPFRHERMTRASRFTERDLQYFLTRRFHSDGHASSFLLWAAWAALLHVSHVSPARPGSPAPTGTPGGSHFGPPLPPPPYPVALTSNVPIVKAPSPDSPPDGRKFACDPKRPLTHRRLRSQALSDALTFPPSRLPALPYRPPQRRTP